MCGNMVCLAAVLLAVDARWGSLPDGGLEYVIQLDPYALDRRESAANHAIRSHVPPYLKDVRAYRIVMDTHGSARSVPTASVHSPILNGVDTDWVPLPPGGVECRVWIRPEVLDELAKPGRLIGGKIPPDVKKPITFMVSVGTKPPGAAITPARPSEQSASRPPLPLPDSPTFKLDARGAQPAGHWEQPQSTLDDSPQAKADSNLTTENESSPQGSAAPWLPHDLTLIGLFASVGGNVFLLWFVWDFRSRYLSLLRRMGEMGDVVGGRASDLERTG